MVRDAGGESDQGERKGWWVGVVENIRRDAWDMRQGEAEKAGEVKGTSLG